MQRRLFLFVVAAGLPGEGPGAARRVLLVFVPGQDFPEAAAIAQAELARRHWGDPQLQGAKEIPADPAAEAEPYAREAIETALREGFALIAYF